MLPLYSFIVLLLSPFLALYLIAFLWRRKEFRAGFRERLGMVAPVSDDAARPRFWLHAVSVGEVMAALPLARALKARWPRCAIFFSTITPAGRAIAEEKCPQASRILFFPLDLWPIARSVARGFRPDLFVLVETDIWPTWLYVLKRRKIPAVMVNGRLSRRRLWARPFYRRVLNCFGYLCMQTEADAARALQIGVDRERVAVTGNMKFAVAVARHEDPQSLAAELGVNPGAPLLIAGSTHPGEETEILDCYQRLRRRKLEVGLVIAPRHPDRTEKLEDLFRARGIACARRSRAGFTSAASVILLDTMGELFRLYGLGTFIFVGGSLVPRGGHNVLEPASWGKPIFFGPYMENYAGIAESLERRGAAIRVKSGAELADQIARLSSNPAELLEMGRRAASFIAENQGCLEKNLAIIERVIAQPTE